ncbi:unknown protein [Seminavis robusta]|uniref:Uncharacterized protein n=1 Tax=Seminavis robusta TaxID=568900 RepID=A0A9N8F1N7_9STRA|nr:unknown protein [Seminavis robusta]|eukprot:Sro2664_g334090.1 n/a (346) ;mRNA; r:6471-7942
MRWRLLLEEFGPNFHYKPGPQNVLGDALSRVPTSREDRDPADSDPLSTSTDGCYSIVEENQRLAECLMHHPDDGMEESFLEHPTFDGEGRNPFNFSVLAEYQAASAVLQQTVMFGNSELICFCQNDEDKIVLTKELLPKLVSFYHKSMAHVEGMDRLEQTIKTHFYHTRGIRDEVRKQMSSAIGQVLRTIVVSRDPKSVTDGIKVISETLATAMHAHRCSVQSMNAYLTPGPLAFKRDMFLDIPIYADILAVQRHRQSLVDKRLLRANAKRISYDYAVDDLVYKRAYLGLSDKLKPTASGPYRVSRVHTNGNVTIQLSPHQFERLNIRRVFPKHPVPPVATGPGY